VREERAAIARGERLFAGTAIALVGAVEQEPRGVAALAAIGAPGRPARAADRAVPPLSSQDPPLPVPELLAALAPPGVRLLFFGGKGGVGKTTCAAAVAIALARTPRRRVLLLSTDPAHSLSDALGVAIGDAERAVPGARGLFARELDGRAAFERERERYREAIDAAFRALVRSPRFDATYDRVVMEDLIDLAPPGIDEVLAVVTLVEALEPPAGSARWDVIVVDTAPTGHTLRLLAMPAAAREWVRALLSILLKYRRVLGLGELASDLLSFSRRLRSLEELLHDRARTSFVAVTRPAELPRLETARLLSALDRARVPAPAIVVNAVTAGTCAACRRAAAEEARRIRALGRAAERSSRASRRAILVAPAAYPPPRGVKALAGHAARFRVHRSS
jgi:arsenite-transporting ATPase